MSTAEEAEAEGVQEEPPSYEEEELKRLKRSRAGHLGDLSKKHKSLQEILSATSDEEVIEQIREKYEESFKRFVDVHERYMELEKDEEKRALIDAVYIAQRDLKWTTEQCLARRKVDKILTEEIQEKSQSNPSSRDRSKSSMRSSLRSVAIVRREFEEARLRMNEIEKKHEIQRQFEHQEQEFEMLREERRSEYRRSLELLEAKSAVDKARTNLELEEKIIKEENTRLDYNYDVYHDEPEVSKFSDRSEITNSPKPDVMKLEKSRGKLKAEPGGPEHSKIYKQSSISDKLAENIYKPNKFSAKPVVKKGRKLPKIPEKQDEERGVDTWVGIVDAIRQGSSLP